MKVWRRQGAEPIPGVAMVVRTLQNSASLLSGPPPSVPLSLAECSARGLTSFWTEGTGSQSSDAAVSGLGFLSSCQPMTAMGGGFAVQTCGTPLDAAQSRLCGPRSRKSSCRSVCRLTLTAPPGDWTLDWEQMTARH